MSERDDDLERELQSHLESEAREQRECGLSAEEARYAAQRALGNTAWIGEEVRSMWKWVWLESLVQDLRYAIRAARKNAGFTAVAVLTLALGIGVNTAVFSVVNTVLLRKPDYREPERLVNFRQQFPRQSDSTIGVSPAEYLDYRDRSHAFSSIAGYENELFDLTGASEPLQVTALRATHTLFSTLGVAPFAGRTFTSDEDRPGAANVLVLNYEFWQRRFGGSPQTVGSVVRLNERPYTVIGIMPPGFEFPFTAADVGEPPALWVPMAFTDKEIQDRAAEFPVRIVARLKPGISMLQGELDAQRVAADFQRERTDIYTGNLVLQVNLAVLGTAAAARTRPVLLTLVGAVLLVLLIACANVTNLLLARAATRQREMAVRNALGASARRLTAQLLTEAMLLTLLGAALGCGLAQAITRLVANLWPSFVSGLAQVHLDVTVLAFVLGISVFTALASGLAPALSWARSDIGIALRQAGRQGATRDHLRLRGLLVVVESASAVILLVGAGLLIHSLVEVLAVPVGFSPQGVLIARTTFNRQRYPSSDRRHEAERQMEQRLAALPGVTAVALTTHIPLADDRKIGFILEGEDVHSSRWADNALVSADYFAAMGIPLLRGRTFGPQDRPDAPLSALVNESMSRRFWPGGDALGKRIVWGGRLLTVIGVVGDVHIGALEAAVGPTIYDSVYQVESGATTSGVFILRTRTNDPASLAQAVREAIWSVDRDVPVFGIRTMEQIVSGSLTTRRFSAALLSAFAILALVLAIVGLYGVLSHAIAQRASELGLRFALGATPAQVLRLVLGDGMRLTLAGLVCGSVLAFVAARAMSHLLFGISAIDLPAFGIAAALLLAIALLASYLPARRASRVDPMVALRNE
ncbi:MAG TPA: ABC transporter permease [Bryobacteraceae bacterium]|nr:ABC transporter permease [Bryobacteraceae bacterium]